MFDIFRNKKLINIDIARNYFRKGNLKKAAKMCEELLKDNEFNTEALQLLSEVYLRDNDLYNYKEVSLKLVDVYIEHNNYNSSTALLKKLIKRFPDDITIYNKLVIVYEKTNMRKELIQTLFTLGDIYLKKDLYTESSEIFVKLLNYNKLDKSIDVCFNIIKRFLTLDNRLMISLAVKDGIAFAKEFKDNAALYKLIDIASKFDCDIGEDIKLFIEYFRTNKSNLGYFIKYCINYFINICVSLDIEFYKAILNSFNYNEIKELINKIHGKYKNIDVYKVEFEIFAERNDLDGLKYLLEYLYKIENPTQDLVDFLLQSHDKVKDAGILYNIALFFIRCKNNIAANIILKRALEAVKEEDQELKIQITDRLNELGKGSGEIEIQEPEIRDLKEMSFKKVASIDEFAKTAEETMPEIDIVFEEDGQRGEVKEDDKNIENKYNEAIELIKNKSYKEAIEVLKPLVGGPKDFDVLFNIGLCYEVMRNLDMAITFYRKALSCTRDIEYKCKLLKKIADIHFDLRDKDETYKTIIEIYKLNPDFFKDL